MNKKILIIENRPDYGLGGVENYNTILLNILKTNFSNVIVHKACLLDIFNNMQNKKIPDEIFHIKGTEALTKNENKIAFKLKIGFHIKKFRKLIYKLENQFHYDLIIDSTITYYEKFKNKNNFIWIQHVTPEFYEMKHLKGFNKYLNLASMKLFRMKNPIQNYNNIVLYDKYNLQYLKTIRNDNFNYNLINLSNKEEILDLNWVCIKERKRIIYFGRIENGQKNIDELIAINERLHLIDFYGKGDKKLIAKLGQSYKGNLEHQDINKIVQKYKFCILLSKYEGYSYSLVESLSNGLPLILSNTYQSAKFLIDKEKNGLLIQKEWNIDKICEEILKLYNSSEEQYLKLVNNSYEFAKNNLNHDLFIDKWSNIFKKYLN
ncbi:MAG: glycosyltransferase [Mycoplasmataceae bacterium]|nr:glycosyltransferase [Mycoplasmataceae bacterium]